MADAMLTHVYEYFVDEFPGATVIIPRLKIKGAKSRSAHPAFLVMAGLDAETSEFGSAKTVSEDAVSPHSDQTESVTIAWRARARPPEELRGSVALW
jgi:hypothetical protein